MLKGPHRAAAHALATEPALPLSLSDFVQVLKLLREQFSPMQHGGDSYPSPPKAVTEEEDVTHSRPTSLASGYC